jgi:hypothetical protein
MAHGKDVDAAAGLYTLLGFDCESRLALGHAFGLDEGALPRCGSKYHKYLYETRVLRFSAVVLDVNKFILWTAGRSGSRNEGPLD